MGFQLIQRFLVWDVCWIGVYKFSCAEKVCYDHAYPKKIMGHLKYLKYNGFLSFVLRKLHSSKELCHQL